MTEFDTSPRSPFSVRLRIVLVLGALGLTALLGTAAILTPAARGQGTHQQLGLPPCTFVVLFDRPCPSCGMTTSWAYLLRGQVVSALRANAGGTLLGAAALLGVPWMLLSAARGRWPGWTPRAGVAASAGIGILAVALLQWGWRMLQ